MNRLVKWGLLAVVVIFLLRVFVLQPVKIENYSMASTIEPTKTVIVSKLGPGVRFPSSIFGLPGTKMPYWDILRIPYFRIPGFGSFKREQIVAFNDPRLTDIPIDRKPLHISRIAGTPGDTLIILDKNLYINFKEVTPPPAIRRLYRVVTDGTPIADSFISENNIEEPTEIADIGMWDILVDTTDYQKLLELPNIKTVRKQLMYGEDSSLGFWPYSNFYRWNRDQVGPLIIPFKGFETPITQKTIELYREIIEKHEGFEVLVDYRGIRIDGKSVDTYTFVKDYYYVLSDNRDNPLDSRHLGYIPRDHLLGKVLVK